MKTNNKPLTLEQQEKLFCDMRNKGVSQVKIARINNLKNSKSIHQVCTGRYNITPLMKRYFSNAGIDLDEIMDNNIVIELNSNRPKLNTCRKKHRRLTKEEIKKISVDITYKLCKKWSYKDLEKEVGLSVTILSKLMSCKYPVSPMIIEGFKKINIDLEDL